MKRKVLIAALGLSAFAGLMAFTQDDPLQALRDAIAELGLRIDRLESAAGGDGAINSTNNANAAPTRKMVMMSVHNVTNPNVNQEEITELEQQCAALMNTVNNKADSAISEMAQAAGAGGVSYQRGGVDGYDGSGGGSEVGGGGGGGGQAGQASGDAQVEARYATLHAIKQQKLDALKAAANQPCQLILGHDGNTVITLQSKVNLTDQLNNIPIGATVTWTGVRVSADDNSETWKVDSISVVK